MFLFLLWLFVIFCLYASGLETAMWVCVIVPGLLFVLALFGNSGTRKAVPADGTLKHRTRIDHPHYISDDEYECTVCGRRFSRNSMSCPHCGVRFTRSVTDEVEYDDELEEEIEMEEWDEE